MDDAIHGGRGGHRILEDGVPLGEDQVASDQDGATLVAFGQEGEEDLHLLAALLDVADVVEEDGLEAVQALELGGKPQVTLGGEQSLDDLESRREEDGTSLSNQLRAERAEQVGLARSRVTQGDYVDGAIEKGSIAQAGQLRARHSRQPLQIEGRQSLFSRQPRL